MGYIDARKVFQHCFDFVSRRSHVPTKDIESELADETTECWGCHTVAQPPSVYLIIPLKE